MGSNRKHIVFIDDSTDELETFERLYSGGRFRVTTILVRKPSDSLQRVAKRLAGEIPDLFVLDLFFPQADSAPTGLSSDAARAAHAQVTRIVSAVSDLPNYFSDGNRLLKEAHGVVVESQRLLSRLCQVLHQSPEGGIRVLKELNRKFASVPKVFYSRKATIGDVKRAMMEGGLDVLSKPHPSVEDREASRLMEDFTRYCTGQPPSWIMQWMKQLPRQASDFMPKSLAELAPKLHRS